LRLIHNKKAQAAMEFLMTYGWAILIVIVAIAALFFLGVFSGSAPNTCQIEAPFNCLDSYSEDNNIYLQVGSLNSVKDVSSDGITLKLNGDATVCATTTTMDPDPLPSGGKTTITCVHNLDVDEKFNGEIIITYDSKQGLGGKTARGTFSGSIKPVEPA